MQVRPTPQKVLIIGAGLSGLVAAYELKKLGHDITIFEAQERPGGRVHTLRSFARGQWADAGAARIPTHHDLTHRYIKEFGLELMPFYPSTNGFMRYSSGSVEIVDWERFADATSAVMGLDEPGHWQKIRGGNDLLPKAFAERLKTNTSYNTPVVAIEQDDRAVRVKFSENGKLQTRSGDQLLCALPFTMVRNIDFSPRLSDQKMSLMARTNYDTASRIFLQTKSRFWADKQLNGFAFGKNDEEIWDSSFGEPGSEGILQTYTRGDLSRTLTRMSASERIEKTIADLSEFHPTLRQHFMSGASKCWSEDPWVQGAWSYLGPMQILTLTQREKRISFAGEHLSSSPGWMQGALQSGLRAVTEITRSNTSQAAAA